MSTWRTHGAFDCFAVAARDLIEQPTVLVILRGEVDVELCSNEKMVDESRFFDVHGCGGIDKSFQSHPVIWAHLDHFHRDPVLVNPSDFRQPDVYKDLLAFQP